VLRERDQYRSVWVVIAGALMAALVRVVRLTWRVRTHNEFLLREALDADGAVLVFWHGEQLPMVPQHGSSRIVGMASLSRDGSLLAEVVRRLGYGLVRGGSSRGSVSALREAVRALQEGVSPALAVDGPRGPAHEVKLGALGLAAWTGRPIVYAVSQCSWAIRLRSWDRFQIPIPGARVDIAYGRMDPPASNRIGMEEGAVELRARMERLAIALKSPLDVPLAG
jgi:lysophospholipid acyltransferase (LPLAT)-like uncharacterized protein